MNIKNWLSLSGAGSVTTGLAFVVILTFCSSPSQPRKIFNEGSSNNQSHGTEVPTVEFCELLRNPIKYESRVVKLSAHLNRFRDDVTFYDPNCIPSHALISVIFSPSVQYDPESETGKKVTLIMNGGKETREGNQSALVSAIGLLKAIPRSERQDFTELQYEFTIQKIE